MPNPSPNISGKILMEKISIDKLEAGDIVWINLNPVQGDEKSKIRPCLVFQKKITPLNLITVLPITDDNGKRQSSFFVKITDLEKAGLHKKSVIDCYQIRTLSANRVTKKIGSISEFLLDETKKAVALILGIHSYHITP